LKGIFEMNKKLKILLIVSLALNLFLAGIITGGLLKPRHHGFQMMKHQSEIMAVRDFMKSHKKEQKAPGSFNFKYNEC